MKYHPVIPWIGSKRRISDWILSKIPKHTSYVEAFCGAAAIYFTKPPSEVEVINDINGELVNMYRVIQHHPEELIRQFKRALSSRQIFEWESSKDPASLTDIQRAARFYYLQKQAFSRRVDGQSFGTGTTSAPQLNQFRIEEDFSQTHLRLQGTYVENLPWDEIVRRYGRQHTLSYLDPPYWGTESYGVSWEFSNYEIMADLARSVSGMLMISERHT